MTDRLPLKYTFTKAARLSRKKYIKDLFETGSSLFIFPLKVLYKEDTQSRIKNNQVLISVPKKFHKTAVKRNRIKRLIREAYRINQFILSDATDKKYFIAYIYVTENIFEFKELENKLKESLVRLKNIALKTHQ